MIANYFFKQDELLRRAVQHYKGKNWKKIGKFMEVTITFTCPESKPDDADLFCLLMLLSCSKIIFF